MKMDWTEVKIAVGNTIWFCWESDYKACSFDTFPSGNRTTCDVRQSFWDPNSRRILAFLFVRRDSGRDRAEVEHSDRTTFVENLRTLLKASAGNILSLSKTRRLLHSLDELRRMNESIDSETRRDEMISQ